MFDLVIRGGTVVDGSGGVPFVGDVAILGGKIAAVGQVAGKGAGRLMPRAALLPPALSIFTRIMMARLPGRTGCNPVRGMVSPRWLWAIAGSALPLHGRSTAN
jgi:hypothetical protein